MAKYFVSSCRVADCLVPVRGTGGGEGGCWDGGGGGHGFPGGHGFVGAKVQVTLWWPFLPQ